MSRDKPTIGKPKKGDTYYRTPEWRKREYAALSDECRAAMHDVNLSTREIAHIFGVRRMTINILRRYYVPERVCHKTRWTPEEMKLLRSDLTTREIAKRIGESYQRVRRMRRKVVGRRRGLAVRYDASTFALLKSKLPTESVATALRLSTDTIAKHRREIHGKRPHTRRVWTDDECRRMLSMTVDEGVEFYGITESMMLHEREKAIKQLGIKTNRKRMQELPRDPAAYAGKTSAELAAEFGVLQNTIMSFCRRNGYEYKKLR